MFTKNLAYYINVANLNGVFKPKTIAVGFGPIKVVCSIYSFTGIKIKLCFSVESILLF